MTWRLPVIGAAVAALLAPLSPALVERYYSSSLFPVLQRLVTGASNRTAIAWFDVLLIGVAVVFLALSVRDLRTVRAPRALGRILIRLLVVAAVAYLAFLLVWGLNYRRQPLREKLAFDPSRITPEAALALTRDVIAKLNAVHAPAHVEGWAGPVDTDPTLAITFGRTAESLGLPAGIRPGRPKHTLLDLYFRRAGVAGMTDPFFLETLVASDTLPFERPQVVAHEWAHLAGITDEGEANFVGWLTCVRGGVAHRYSGWLFLYNELVSTLPADAARDARAALQEGPRADLRAMRARYDREVSPRISGAGWQVYDSYLKANRVDAGTRSYAEVVQLVLGTGMR